MLGKLLKHELKATCRYLLPLCLILLVLSSVTRLVLSFDIFEGTLDIIPNMVMVTYIISIIVLVVAIILLMIYRFYKNLLSEEGYLMFTLPVKCDRLINSKLLISIFWIFAGIIAVIASLFIAFATPDAIKQLFDTIEEILAELGTAFAGRRALLITELIAMILIGFISNILLIYVSIAVGQLFTRHKIAGSLIAYLCINTATDLFSVLIIVIMANILGVSFIEMNSIPEVIFPISIATSVLFSCMYYFTTYYIFKNRLNLD